MRLKPGFVCLALLISVPLPSHAAAAGDYRLLTEKLKIPMSDGVHLAATVVRPDAPGEKFPARMLLRYWQTGEQEAQFFAPKGYACVLVDCRGRGASEGKWVMYVNDPRDGYDAQQWIGKQPWCDGKIGMFGGASSGSAFRWSAPRSAPSPASTAASPSPTSLRAR